jgi:hypothetical protein
MLWSVIVVSEPPTNFSETKEAAVDFGPKHSYIKTNAMQTLKPPKMVLPKA